MARETPEQRLLRTARSPEDAAALERFDDHMALPLVLAALLPLFMLPGGEHEKVAAIVNIAAWIVFLVDLVVHQHRLTRYLHTWLGRFDLSVVILTAPWFLITGPSGGKFVILIRFARLARLVMAGTGARRLFARIGRVAIVAAGVIFVGAAFAYRAEHHVNPEFATYGDSLWWSVVTLTTVGYGDVVPITQAGRLIGVMIMFTGVAVLGVLAGTLAGFFGLTGKPGDDSATAGAAVGGSGEVLDPSGAGPPGAIVDLRDEVVALREQVGRLSDQIALLVADRSDPPDRAADPPT